VADYLAGMTLEGTHEADDIEAADEEDDPGPRTPHTPRRDPVRDHQEIVGVGKRKYPQKPCRVCAANIKHKDTKYIRKTCKVIPHKEDCFTRYHTRMKD
jgi:hypothetical protein